MKRTIGMIPTSYQVSMSYEEQVEEIKNKVKQILDDNNIIIENYNEIVEQYDIINQKYDDIIVDYEELLSNYQNLLDKINANTTAIGTLANLNTTEKTNLVGAINEVDTNTDNNTTSIGTLANLNTTEKTNLVGAINEVDTNTDNNTTSIGTLSNLNTTEKTNLVGAINEVNGRFSGLIITDEFTSDNITVSANSTFSYSFDITKTGYKALGILWVDCFSSDVVLAKYSQYDNTAYIRFRNMTSSNITTNYKIKVLYIKN